MSEESHAESMREVASFLRSSKSILIFSHVNPDGDTLGSSLALAIAASKHGCNTTIYNANGVPYFLRFLPSSNSITTHIPNQYFDAVFFIDSSEPHRFGKEAEEFLTKRNFGKSIKIDHHKTSKTFADIEIIDTNACATGALVFELLKREHFDLTPEIAQNLYTAIATDTGFFRYSNTSKKSFDIASELVAHGANPNEVHEYVNEQQPIEQLKMLSLVLGTLKVHFSGRLATMVSYRKWQEELGVGEEIYEGFSSYPRSIAGVEVAVFIYQTQTGSKLSLRSKRGVDILPLAEALGGGGHPNAAGARLSVPPDKALERVLELSGRLLFEKKDAEGDGK